MHYVSVKHVAGAQTRMRAAPGLGMLSIMIQNLYSQHTAPALHAVPHYHGDHVRQIFLACALVLILAIPLIGELVPYGPLVQVVVALVYVALAGITNPHSTVILWCDIAAAAFGVVVLEFTALSAYETDSTTLFVVRETMVVALLFAFYFGIKTLRARILGRLGKPDTRVDLEEQ